jgi:1,4-alpha-glucan branching enzyme
MPCRLTVHFDSTAPLSAPLMHLHQIDSEPRIIQPEQHDGTTATFTVEVSTPDALIAFADGDTREPDALLRRVFVGDATACEVWARSWHPFVLMTAPQPVDARPAAEIAAETPFRAGQYISEEGGRFGLGANLLSDGGVQFAFFHPHAARVYVAGTFNDWAHPGREGADEARFIPMTLHRGFFDAPNVWIAHVENAKAGDEYQFFVVNEAQTGDSRIPSMQVTDPYARALGADYQANNAVVVDAGAFAWDEGDYHTPAIHDLILYSLHVSGFTHGHDDVPPEHQGTFQGIIDRIESGYFEALGVTALYLLPVAEAPTPQGINALGYNTSVFTAIERDFGTPDDLRRLVQTAHRHGLAVILDQVFNHTANEFNPLWKLILDHPDEWGRGEEGGLYFSGESPWGNRTSTERAETGNLLIDVCRLLLTEYHVDGFRFDYTHSSVMHHAFMNRMADALQAAKPDVVLIAENMPNESDLNREGYNGYAQWHDHFHDGVKALLREGPFEGIDDHPEVLGEMFYFSKGSFAAHTNNVVNYCESHDENSVPFEVATSPEPNLNTPPAKARKSRLGFAASMLALGQPMIYMGQEFCVERERNVVHYPRPSDPAADPFFNWARGIIHLRRRYPSLRLHGFDPMADKQFTWIVGPWLNARQGAGRRVIGWRAAAAAEPEQQMAVLFNFENHPVEIDLELGLPGVWLCVANIDAVHDQPPVGDNGVSAPSALHTADGRAPGFVLPDSSVLVYTWGAAES